MSVKVAVCQADMIAILIKEPAKVTPEKPRGRRMRVVLLVGVLMVHSMNGNPASRGVLQATGGSEDGSGEAGANPAGHRLGA